MHFAFVLLDLASLSWHKCVWNWLYMYMHLNKLPYLDPVSHPQLMFALDFHPRHSFPSLWLAWKTWNMANWQNLHNRFISRSQSSLLLNRKCQLLKIISILLCVFKVIFVSMIYFKLQKNMIMNYLSNMLPKDPWCCSHHKINNTIIQQALLLPAAQWNSPVLTWFQRKMVNTDWKPQKTGGFPILLYGSSFNLISFSSRLSGQAHTK